LSSLGRAEKGLILLALGAFFIACETFLPGYYFSLVPSMSGPGANANMNPVLVALVPLSLIGLGPLLFFVSDYYFVNALGVRGAMMVLLPFVAVLVLGMGGSRGSGGTQELDLLTLFALLPLSGIATVLGFVGRSEARPTL